MSRPLKKFSTQADEQLLTEIKNIAQKEGKLFQVLVNEAFEDLIEKHKKSKPRNNVMAQFNESLEDYDDLYKKLAQ